MSTDSVSELAEIAVRIHADTAAIRYRSEIEATPEGETSWRLQLHTDVYERRGDHWQIVESQATAIGQAAKAHSRTLAQQAFSRPAATTSRPQDVRCDLRTATKSQATKIAAWMSVLIASNPTVEELVEDDSRDNNRQADPRTLARTSDMLTGSILTTVSLVGQIVRERRRSQSSGRSGGPTFT